MGQREPNLEVACEWFPPLCNAWVPLGWKNHRLRFAVLYEGTVIGLPHINRRTEEWRGKDFQIMFIPSADGTLPPELNRVEPYRLCDLNMRVPTQQWNDCPAPVLRTEWEMEGITVQKEIFGHITGGSDVETGVEPLYAWVRLSVHRGEGAKIMRYGVLLKINAVHIDLSMDYKRNLTFDPSRSEYPRPLRAEHKQYSPEEGYRLIEDGKIRLAIPPGQQCNVQFTPHTYDAKDDILYLEIPVGTNVDILLPMIPADDAVLEEEMALGYDAALREANSYWSKVPITAACVNVPEIPVNEAIKHSLRFAEVLAEKLADGGYSMVSGSPVYADLWATPHSMACIMLLDTLGYHEVVEKYLEIFREQQGTVLPPGHDFTHHTGYLSTPKSLTSIDWLSDHGALLYTVTEHALLSGDKSFIARWTEAIVRACEFIKYFRAVPRDGIPGIMPPAVATDMMVEIQAVWNDGWLYKGLSNAVRLLEIIGHPRAAEFAEEAREYRDAFDKAIREQSVAMEVWTDKSGEKHHLVPADLSNLDTKQIEHVFYLDTGPLFLVYAGLLPASDQLMCDTLLFFREGPHSNRDAYDGSPDAPPFLYHEISSWEPCYSWNVFHSHQLGDRYKYLEGMYSLFAGTLSRSTFISCESRGGITGNIFSAPLAVYLARLAVVDDQIEQGALHLLRLMPLAWLHSDRDAVFENMPTEFGPVSLKVRLSSDEKMLELVLTAAFRRWPERVMLHIPSIEGLEAIVLNAEPLPWDGKSPVLPILL